jgi:hypothetical protein
VIDVWVETVKHTLSKYDVKQIAFEVPLRARGVAGRIDCIAWCRDGRVVVLELKCVKALTHSHLLQVALYRELVTLTMLANNVTALLLNLNGGELIEVHGTDFILDKCI